MSFDYLGYSGKFFPKVCGDRGFAVGSALVQGLLTLRGERVMRPTLGGDLSALIFSNMSQEEIVLFVKLRVTDLIAVTGLPCVLVDVDVRNIGYNYYITIVYETNASTHSVSFVL